MKDYLVKLAPHFVATTLAVVLGIDTGRRFEILSSYPGSESLLPLFMLVSFAFAVGSATVSLYLAHFFDGLDP